ncbi:ABC transporter permease [Paenibacillus contaminans]|uniref:Transport permease protein n=1 Tax=Paenibacillus contaminans TaxID=450362 RepID=A0A329MIE7_9BACL|nr:ABC transporter permease [Paenibacillus contaminans]RAV19432.1 ABC transporter permease [Paenibacillus contaminans]
MKDTIWLIRKTGISTFKNYKNWLLYFVLPVLAIGLAVLTRGQSGDMQVKIGYLNNDSGQVMTQDMIAFIERLDSVLLSEIKESEVKDKVVSGDLDAALIFPAGFAQSLKSGTPESVQIVSIKGAEITGYVKSSLNQYIDNMASITDMAGGDGAAFEAMYADFQNSGFHVTAETIEDRSVNYRKSNQSMGYLIVLMLFAAASLSGILIKERENRTYHRIITSPVKARTYVISNILVNLAVMVAQIAITLVVMIEIFRVDPGLPYWKMFLILGLFALVAISLSLAIMAFSKSSMAANAVQNILFLPTCLLAGCMFPIEIMPAMMQKIAYFLPQYWVLDSFGKLQEGNSLGVVYVNLLILVAFAITLSLITIYKFSKNNDTRSYI